MPIRPENRALYPVDWPAISQAIRQRAGRHCERCGIPDRALGGRKNGIWYRASPTGETTLGLDWPRPGDWAWCHRVGLHEYLRIVRIVLTVAHLDHDPTNCDEANLQALCQRCHLNYDARHHHETALRTRRAGAAIGDLLNG